MPSILVATPMYGGMNTKAYFNSCMRLQAAFISGGMESEWLTQSNESLVHRARNQMTATWLQETSFSHMLWLDADIEFEPQDVAKLWNLETDIACGVYAMKKKDKQWFAAWKDGELVRDLDKFNGPIEVDYCGTGFLLISRKAAEAVYEKKKAFEREARELADRLKSVLNERENFIMSRLIDNASADYEALDGQTIPALYMTPIFEGCLESEDYHFCRWAREAGFSVIMDPSVRLKHWGQYPYGEPNGHS